MNGPAVFENVYCLFEKVLFWKNRKFSIILFSVQFGLIRRSSLHTFSPFFLKKKTDIQNLLLFQGWEKVNNKFSFQ